MANPLFPIWKGRYVYRETFLPLRNEQGAVEDIDLLYPAEEILEVVDANLKRRYEGGKDYCVVDGKLRIPEGSAIRAMTWDEYYPAEPIPGGTFGKTGGGNIRFSEGRFYHDLEYCVSYRHTGKWPGNVPADKLDRLPRTKERLENGEPLRLLFYGDSITAKANSSALIDAAPFQADWCQLTAETLEEVYGSRVTLINTAVGGTTSRWGVAEARERAVAQKPDLMVLGFGMNDAGAVETEEFIENLKKIMTVVREQDPACECVLMSTMLPNAEAAGFMGRQKEYEAAMPALEAEGTVVCDMTAMHETLLTRKAYRDMTGNNVNHPNDFLSRVYAQTLLATLGVG